MTDTNLYLLKMIKDNLSTQEICEKLNISKKQLRRRINSLKYEGININRDFFYDGTSKYIVDNNILSTTNSYLIKGVNEKFRALAISDTHIGHRLGNMDYIKIIYEYCNNNDINIIIHCGDLFEGDITNIITPSEQIEYLIDKYPSNGNILTFVCFGNHDESFIKKQGLDIKTILENSTNNIIPIGYGECQMKIFENVISISHLNRFSSTSNLKLAGHSHRFKFGINNNQCPSIIVPTLSDYLHTNDYPGALELEINLFKQHFNKLIVKHLIINEKKKVKQMSSIDYSYQRRNNVRK